MKSDMVTWAMLLYGTPGTEDAMDNFAFREDPTDEDAYLRKLCKMAGEKPWSKTHIGRLPGQDPRVWYQTGHASVTNDMDWMNGERPEGPPDMPRGEFLHGNYVEDALIDQLDRKFALEEQGLNPEDVLGTFEVQADVVYGNGTRAKPEFQILVPPDSSIFDEVDDYCRRVCRAELRRFTYRRKAMNGTTCKKAA
ncbi:hypothetical protein KJ969_01050 [Patescibacteria group bacterium]|nr:hypothetical protein [Patescibacteria group bacterium]MBU1922446.1 hypothetical protein [Patescibacteria group bacterium]